MKKSLSGMSGIELLQRSREVSFLLEDKAEAYEKTANMLKLLDSGDSALVGVESLEDVRQEIVKKLKEEIKGVSKKAEPGIIGKIKGMFSSPETKREAAVEAVYFVMSVTKTLKAIAITVEALKKKPSEEAKVEDVVTDTPEEKEGYYAKLTSLLQDTSQADERFRAEAQWIKNYGKEAETIAEELASMTMAQLKSNLKAMGRLLKTAPNTGDMSAAIKDQRSKSRTPKGQDINVGRTITKSIPLKRLLQVKDDENWIKFVSKLTQNVTDQETLDKILSLQKEEPEEG